MTENVFTPHTEPPAEPMLRRNLELPKGVLQKNLKTFVYLGAASLVIVAALFSSSGKKMQTPQAKQVASTLRIRKAASNGASEQPGKKISAGVESTPSLRSVKA